MAKGKKKGHADHAPKPPKKLTGLIGALMDRVKTNETEGIIARKKRHPKGRPLPPDLTKDIFLKKVDISLFGEIEKHTSTKMSQPTFSYTFNKLIKDLLIEHMTEIETIRVIFMWIIWQDYPAIKALNFPDNMKNDTPMSYFRDILYGEKTFAQLFARMAKEADIYVQEINGYLKGTSYFPDYEFTSEDDTSRASWNAVFVDGHWRFIDVRRALPAAVFDKSTRTNKSWEEFYFLTNPRELICTHFPDDKLWQLLNLTQVVKLHNFSAAPKKWPIYFSNQMKLPTDLPGLIGVSNKGFIQFEISIPLEARHNETYKCEMLTRKMSKTIEKLVLTRNILHYTLGNKDIIQIFCPKRGSYIVELYAMSTKIGLNVFNITTMYQLNCYDNITNYDSDFQPPFPAICSFYGMSPLAYHNGIGVISPENSLVKCDKYGEGRFKIYHNAKEKGKDVFLEYVQNLYESEAGQDEPLPDRVLQCTVLKEGRYETTFLFRVTQEGNFALILYYNRNQKTPEYVDFAHVMVSWKKPSGSTPIPLEFPHVKQGRVGAVEPNCSDLGIRLAGVYPSEPNDVDEAWITADEFGEVMMFFEHSKPRCFMVENVDNSVETMIECTPKYSYITVRTQTTEDRRSFVLKVFAAELGKSENIPQIFQFMIIVNKPAKRSLPLPKCPSYYWGGVQNKLIENNTYINGYEHSISWTQDKFNIKTNDPIQKLLSSTMPCRLYQGGEDMELHLNYASPYAIKPMLKLLEKGRTVDHDKFCFSQTTHLDSCCIRARFPRKGVFVLALFCAPLYGDEQQIQLKPFYYSLIVVDETSDVTKPFPSIFTIWSSSCHNLVDGLTAAHFKKNKECEYKIDLTNFVKDEHNKFKEEPYAEVLLLVDDKKVVKPRRGMNPGVYEWVYTPPKEAKVISVVVVPKAGSDEVLYVLQYNVAA